MPAIVTAIASIAASALTTSALTGAVIGGVTISATTASFIGGVVGLVVSTGLSLLLNQAPKIASTAVQAADRKQALRSGTAPRNIVYGRALVAGPVIHMSSSGIYFEYIHVVMPLAGHPVHAFDAVKINGFTIPITDYTAGGDGTAGSGVGGAQGHAARVFVTIQAGTPQGTIEAAQISTTDYPSPDLFHDSTVLINLFDGTQATACADLIAALPTEWDSSMIVTGLPYVHVMVRYQNDLFPGGFQSLAVELRGKKVWDPRTNTTGYSDNAVLCALDYLMGEDGLGVPSSEIDTDIVEASANVADELVAIDVAETTFQPRYTINGSFKLDATPADIIEALLNGWGTYTYVQGKYRLHAAAAEASVLSLTASDFAGPVEVVRNHARRDQFNVVTGTYIEPSQGWVATAFPKVASATHITEDGSEEVPVTLDLPFVVSPYYAQRLARLRLLTHRAAGFQLRGALKYSALRAAIWDVVDVTLEEFGLDGDTFRITRYSFDPASGLVNVLLQSDVPEAYAWTASDGDEPIIPDVTDLASPLSLPVGETPTLAAERAILSDGTVVPRILVTWAADAIASPYVTATEIQWRDFTASDEWASVVVPLPGASTYIGPVVPGHTYQVRLRYHAQLVRGAWSTTATLAGEGAEVDTPTGPTGAAVTAILGGYRVTFTKDTAADIAATEVGEQTSPFTPVSPSYVGETTGDTFVRMTASGDYAARDVYVRSRNTAGQRSAWALVDRVTPEAVATIDIGANAVSEIYGASTTTRFATSSSVWVNTGVSFDVDMELGEQIIIAYVARVENYDSGTTTGGGAEGGSDPSA